MRQFNLIEALNGAKVVTRDGRKVIRMSCDYLEANMYPITAYFGDGLYEDFTITGKYLRDESPHLLDLMMEDKSPLNVGDDIQFLYEGEILDGKVTHVLQNNRVIARSNGSNPVFANVGMYDVCTINKNGNE